MPMTRDQIFAEVQALAPGERERLIEDLRQVGDDALSDAQRDELRRRLESIRDGEAILIDGDDALRQLRAQFGQR